MRYYYVPSTYRGYKFGTGIRAGAMKGYGAIVGGSLTGGYAATTVDTPADVPALPEDVQNKVAEAEETGKPAEIGKKNWQLWSAIKNDAGNLWDMAKSGAKSLGSKVSEQYNKLPDGVKTGLKVGQSVGLFALGNPTLRKMILGFGYAGGRRARFVKGSPEAKEFMRKLRAMRRRGRGYSGGMRLRKGSPEAKAYMAKLRAMRKKKRGMGYGGTFKGVGMEKLGSYLNKEPTEIEDRKGNTITGYMVKDGDDKMHAVSAESVRAMYEAAKKIRAQGEKIHGMKKEERENYFKKVYGLGKYRKPPYKYMTFKRHKTLLKRLINANRNNRAPNLDFYLADYGGIPRASDAWMEKWALMKHRHRYHGENAQSRKKSLRDAVLENRYVMKQLRKKKKKHRKTVKLLFEGVDDSAIRRVKKGKSKKYKLYEPEVEAPIDLTSDYEIDPNIPSSVESPAV